MVAYPIRTLVCLYWMLALITQYEMIKVWDTVSTCIHLPRMFLSTNILFEQRIGQFTMDLLWIRFSFYTKDNQQ